jgi:uncharacterized protein (TIGR02246 family)
MNGVAGKIRSANQSFCESLRQRDAAAFAALYTAGAKLLPPHSDFVEGGPAIQAYWAAALERGMTEASLETVEVEVLGDMAIEVGRYQMGAGGQTVDRGKYIVVWKNENGDWKLHRDVWNSSLPRTK